MKAQLKVAEQRGKFIHTLAENSSEDCANVLRKIEESHTNFLTWRFNDIANYVCPLTDTEKDLIRSPGNSNDIVSVLNRNEDEINKELYAYAENIGLTNNYAGFPSTAPYCSIKTLTSKEDSSKIYNSIINKNAQLQDAIAKTENYPSGLWLNSATLLNNRPGYKLYKLLVDNNYSKSSAETLTEDIHTPEALYAKIEKNEVIPGFGPKKFLR